MKIMRSQSTSGICLGSRNEVNGVKITHRIDVIDIFRGIFNVYSKTTVEL